MHQKSGHINYDRSWVEGIQYIFLVNSQWF